MSHHAGEELVFLISGEIELRIGGRVEVLRRGDCVHFDSTIPHRLTALTAEPAAALVVIAQTDARSPPLPADPDPGARPGMKLARTGDA